MGTPSTTAGKASFCGAGKYTDPALQQILANSINISDGRIHFDPRRVISTLKNIPFDTAVLLDTCFGACATKAVHDYDPITEILAATLDVETYGGRNSFPRILVERMNSTKEPPPTLFEVFQLLHRLKRYKADPFHSWIEGSNNRSIRLGPTKEAAANSNSQVAAPEYVEADPDDGDENDLSFSNASKPSAAVLLKVSLASAHPGPTDLKQMSDWLSTDVPQLVTHIKCELVEPSDCLCVILKLSREAFHYLVDDPAYEFICNVYSLAAAEPRAHFKDGARSVLGRLTPDTRHSPHRRIQSVCYSPG